jgi:hypothetical protein
MPRTGRPRSQAFDPAEELGKHGAWHRYLGQLEHPVAAVAHDLDRLLAQRGQRPLLDLSGSANVRRKLARLQASA